MKHINFKRGQDPFDAMKVGKNYFDDINLHDMLSKGKIIMNKTFEIHKTLYLADYPNYIITNNIFITMGKNITIIFPYSRKGIFTFNTIIQK